MQHWSSFITENAGRHDREWLAYQYAAFRKRIGGYLRKQKLSPVYNMLKTWQREIEEVRSQLLNVESGIPKRLMGWKGRPPRAVYMPEEGCHPEDESLTQVLNALHQINSQLFSDAVSLKEWGLSMLEIEHLGIEPVYRDQGFILIPKNSSTLGCFRYTISPLLHSNEREFIHLQPVTRIECSSFSSSLDIRRQVMKNYSGKGVPGVYRVSSSLELPYWQTLRPLAKRKLLEYIKS